ncbi:cation-translocating P-type ATPase [Phaeovulum sp. NW3]|uniref:cation-translocating P-type ATPase n=1 Tax=Phaeovulum sp. NW3 TaxID=2934933 RepID=UPI00202009AC|nr:cation-translocating P-type ATPase [Phaeovulum sp. NW3]MCL7464062.1 cation-translocating P-type ATPase [Phaeovulum sp. NW3]
MADVPTGLGLAEAAARLAAEGPNELPRARRRSGLRILAEVLREPMLLLLVLAAIVYLIFGDLHEALILLVVATLSVTITAVQESRTERVLEALRDLSSPRALVLRGGERLRIPGREVVRGDLLILAEGDRIPADAQLLQAEGLSADESLLTGESVPVRKRAAPPDEPPCATPGGEDLAMVFSGAMVVRGAGIARVTATGAASAIGRIGHSLATLDSEPPRLRAQTARLVRLAGVFGGTVSIAVVLLYGSLHGDWLQAALAGIALGMAMLPEEFPVVLTVFMAMGAWRISRARVLTRRAASIEALGAATVLCTDKTGTLTQNRMMVARLCPAPGADGDQALRTGLLASAPHPVDPMDAAFHALAGERGITATGADGQALQLARSFGLRDDLLAVTQIWTDTGPGLIAAAKGAPEAIATLCRADPETAQWLRAETNRMAGDGLRVLGLARAEAPGPTLPDAPEALDFWLVGLAGLADPLRDSVPQAVRECQQAGIRVVMITGDYPVTARAIAAKAGLPAGAVMTGAQIDALDDDRLAQALADTAIFARVLPDQKLRLVTALKARGEVVAMTGDGVNDAPALKAAHIGIAMGGRGTDVAREAAGIVLLDDDFSSIVRAVRLGRRIYDNLRKAMGFIVAVHVPIAGLALMPLLLGTPIVFGPLHIALMELLIDPVCALVFEAEPEEDDTMRRPPRPPSASLFSPAMLGWGLIQGLVAFAVVAAVYFEALGRGLGLADLRTLTFLALVGAVLGLIYVNRSYSASPWGALVRPNRALALVPVAVALVLAPILLWPPAAAIFGFALPGAADLARVAGAAALGFLALEAVKRALGPRLRR